MDTTTTPTCAYCAANAGAYAARQEHGILSPEHRAALEVLRPLLPAARLGRAHSAGCPDRWGAPLVRLR